MAPTVSPIARFLMRVVFSCYRSVRLIVLRLTSPTDERAARAVVSGAAWDEFCDTLKAAGASLVAPGAPTDAFNQAEGYRYLARLTRAGLENFLECADPEAPRLCAIANGDRPAPVKLGSDNPDNLYENATIDGRLEYVVSGTRGTVSYLGLGTQSGSYGGKGGLATVDYVEAEALTYAAVIGTIPAQFSETHTSAFSGTTTPRARASRSSSPQCVPKARSIGWSCGPTLRRRCSSSARPLRCAAKRRRRR